jgi:hypothetical protein
MSEPMRQPKHPAVDTKCYELAEHFLRELPQHTDKDIWELAGMLQAACEVILQEVEARK